MHRLNMMEMEKGEKDLFVLGLMHSLRLNEEQTTRGKKRKKRCSFHYRFNDLSTCSGAFRYIYDLGTKHYRNLVTHLCVHGPCARVHGNKGRRPHHAFTFPVVERCVAFIFKSR